MIEIIINNKSYKFEKIITVLQACEQANILVPRFCYHEKLSVAGSCRMCLVEIEKSPKPVASCAMPISNGMVIFTDTPLVKKAQESVLELLLINHPLDCPICDQGGECDLQDITLNYGTDRTRFFEIKRVVEDKYCGPIIKTIMTRCIHCTRCVRFLSELAGIEVFGSIGRGEVMEIGTYLNKYIKTELSGNLVDICPVGALTSKPYAFLARSWELKKIETIDFSDALGSNILIQTRNNTFIKNYNNTGTGNIQDQILRILPKVNENINEVWISDKTRYSFDGLNILRLNEPLFNTNQKIFNQKIGWKNWLKNFSIDFQKSILNKNIFIGNIGTILSIDELFFFSLFLKNYGFNNFLINNELYNINTDLPYYYQYNSLIKNIENSDLILLIGTNPRIEGSMLNLKLRKHYINKNITIGLIGTYVDLTYPVVHLGNSLKTLLNIIEGKNNFCKLLRKSKNPLIIVGTEFAFRSDSQIIQNLLRVLIKRAYLYLNNILNINFLHSNIGQINFCELSLNSNNKSITYLLKDKNIYNNENILYIFNNINELNIKTNKLFLSLNTHRFSKDNLFKYIAPINSFYERNNISFNIEGLVQKSFKSKTALNYSRNSEDIFKSIICLNSNKNNNQKEIKNLFTKKWLYIEAPFLKNSNIYRKKFNFNFLNIEENGSKIFLTNFKPLFNNFYMTDNISKNSKIMAECTLFLNNKNNFNKIY